MHPNGRDFITDQYILSPNKVMAMAVTCGQTFMVHLARLLDTTHVQEVIYEHSCIRRSSARRAIVSHLYDKVDLDEVILWAASGGQEIVIRLCRDWGVTNSIDLWPIGSRRWP